jgi:hypothetical protein
MLTIVKGELDETLEKKKELLKKKQDIYFKLSIENLVKNDLKKFVFYGVTYIQQLKKDEIEDVEDLETILMLFQALEQAISKLTYREAMQMFPIIKDYSGHKFECKDYFSTMEYLQDKDLDMPIGDDLDEFIWNYYNTKLMVFATKELVFYDLYGRMHGRESFMASFSREFNIPYYTINKETGYIFNHATNKTQPFKPAKMIKRSPYLKLVKPN